LISFESACPAANSLALRSFADRRNRLLREEGLHFKQCLDCVHRGLPKIVAIPSAKYFSKSDSISSLALTDQLATGIAKEHKVKKSFTTAFPLSH
jgi:hypothetical protein